MKKLIENTIDFFYPPFQKVMNKLTFRYAACGAANTTLDIFLFFISYNFIFKKQLVEANRIGLLNLSRADLIQAMNPDDVAKSATRYLNAVFHFVRL
jgi:hypothetical protein